MRKKADPARTAALERELGMRAEAPGGSRPCPGCGRRCVRGRDGWHYCSVCDRDFLPGGER